MLIGHISDTHLLHTQYGFKWRSICVFNSFCNSIRKAKESNVDFMVHSGDVIDKDRPSSLMIAQLDSIDKLLKELNLRMFTIQGNHEISEPSWYDRYLDNNAAGIIPMDDRIIPINKNISIVGFKYRIEKDFDEYYESLAREGKIKHTDIGIWHGAIQEFFGLEKSVPLEKLLKHGIPTWLVGDLHKNQRIFTPEYYVGYPGSTDMTNISHDPIKYVDIIEVDDKTGRVIKCTPTQFESTPVWDIYLNSPEVLQDTLDRLETHTKSLLIWCKYDNAFSEDVHRLEKRMDPKRMHLIPSLVRKTEKSKDNTEENLVLLSSPTDLVSRLVNKKEDPDLYELAALLSEPATNTNVFLEQFINKQLQ